MTVSASPTCTTGSSYYKVYRTNSVKLYYPSSTSVATNTATYRNAFYGTETNYTVVLGSSNTATSNVSNSSVPSGYTFAGYASAVSNNTVAYADVAAVAASTATAVYAVGTKSVTPTFYYSNSAAGGKANVTGTAATQYVRCKSTSAAELNNSNFTVPTLTGETAPTGTVSVGWATSASTVPDSPTSTPNTSSASWYKVYRNTVTVYKPTSTSACNSTNTVFYRNAFYGTGTSYEKVLATAKTGTTENASYTSGVSGYTFIGFASALSNNTVAYADIAALRNSSATTAYALLDKEESENATFYYSNSAAGAKTSTTAGGTKTTFIRCKSTSAAETNVSNGSISVPSAVSGSKGPYNGTYVNVASAVNSMSAATVNTATTT